MRHRKCKHEGCEKYAAPKRRECYSCMHKAEKKKDLAKYTYGVLRRNARRRGIEFTLTLEEFRTFCVKTDYLNGKHRGKEGLSVDRIDRVKGYSADNIQVLTVSENSKKYHRKVEFAGRDEYNNPTFKTVTNIPATKIEYPDMPF